MCDRPLPPPRPHGIPIVRFRSKLHVAKRWLRLPHRRGVEWYKGLPALHGVVYFQMKRRLTLVRALEARIPWRVKRLELMVESLAIWSRALCKINGQGTGRSRVFIMLNHGYCGVFTCKPYSFLSVFLGNNERYEGMPTPVMDARRMRRTCWTGTLIFSSWIKN